jgi:hypothetical protein
VQTCAAPRTDFSGPADTAVVFAANALGDGQPARDEAAAHQHEPQPLQDPPTPPPLGHGFLLGTRETRASSTGGGTATVGTATATIPADAVRVEGVIRAIRGTCPELGLNLNGRIILTGIRTGFEGKTCTELQVRDRVVVIVHKVSDKMPIALKVLSRAR